MQLTGQQVIELGILSNYCQEGIQQQGVDVRVAEIREVYGVGTIPATGKTRAWPTRTVEQSSPGCYYLEPGYYEVVLMEGCNIPNNIEMDYKTRSSLVRCGATIHSGQFDAGFKTEAMGCFMHVRLPIIIHQGARIAQAVFNETYPVNDENLYDGQWQNDKQRSEVK